MMGSTATYVAPLEDFKVIVSGEVPPATIKAIAGAFRAE